VQMISLGIIGEYLSRIFLEVKGRPTFLIGSIVEGRDAVTPIASPPAAENLTQRGAQPSEMKTS